METRPIFTIDWEDWNHALHISGESRIKEPTLFLLNIFRKYNVRAIFYTLGRAVIENPYFNRHFYNVFINDGHIIGSHGTFHDHNETSDIKLFRSPYWDTTPMPWPPAGGFFFRFMPFWYVKWAVKKSCVFWIHPHDLDEDHPRLKNPFMNWKRHVGLKTARKKLERLLKEVQFGDPKVS